MGPLVQPPTGATGLPSTLQQAQGAKRNHPPTSEEAHSPCCGATATSIYRTELGTYAGPECEMNEDGCFDEHIGDSRRIRLADLVHEVGDRFVYEYDFGDGWEHIITCEAILPGEGKRLRHAHCLDGARACPPEDVGGPGSYERFLEILADPDHPEHEDMVRWSTGYADRPFDPEHFDRELVNQLLQV